MESFVSPLSGNILRPQYSVRDYLVSQEVFNVFYDSDWDMLLTLPVPENLASYYESKDYAPHRLSKNSFFDLIYQVIRKQSFRYKYRILKEIYPGFNSVLDFGAATGLFLSFLQSKNIEICGVEPNENARKTANLLTGNKVYSDLSACNGKFDIITLWHVLEHVKNPVKLIGELEKKLNPGGMLVIALPNFKSYDSEYYEQYWAAYDVPRHLWHFSPRSIIKLFSPFKFQLIARKPLIFDSFYVSLLSEQYKNGKKRWLPAFFNGLKSNLKARKTGNYSSLIYILQSTANKN
jgi:SAM-dependent methyltransferase